MFIHTVSVYILLLIIYNNYYLSNYYLIAYRFFVCSPKCHTVTCVLFAEKTNGNQFLALLTAFKVVGEQSYTHTPEKALKRTRGVFSRLIAYTHAYAPDNNIIFSSFFKNKGYGTTLEKDAIF